MSESRAAFYQRIATVGLTPLWEVLARLVPRSPTAVCAPVHWRYTDVRPYLMEAGQLISAHEAERRVLILENPAHVGEHRITSALYGGLQLILPGEVAPPHRHTQSALRFIVEGQGAFTSVDGERTTMEPGDFIVTPPWSWHAHGHNGQTPMVWLDGLDIPLIQYLGCGFSEGGVGQPIEGVRPEGTAQTRYGAGLQPAGTGPRPHEALRPRSIFNYRYRDSRRALGELERDGDFDARRGPLFRFVDPQTGRDPLGTIAAFIQLVPKDGATAMRRATDATVFCVVEGEGETEIGEGADRRTFGWGPHDIVVVPNWTPHRHRARTEAVLFSYSDRPVQEALGLFREAFG